MKPPDKETRLKLFLAILVAFTLFEASAQPGPVFPAESAKMAGHNANRNMPDSFMHKLLSANPQYFSEILAREKELRVQVIYTRIDRVKKNKPFFTDYAFNAESSDYFYPASTVKLPVAILALQKLNELNMEGLSKFSTMYTAPAGERLPGVVNDPSASDGRPTIAHYIKKILLVSDNDAFNRLYEFLGQEYINNSLHKMGYNAVQIIHRLSLALTEEENRLTNAVTFIDSAGRILYHKPEELSRYIYKTRQIKMGQGYIKNDELIEEPFDFSVKNVLPLKDLHEIVKSIFFPGSMPKEKQFNLKEADYVFLRKYMSMLPGESASPKYDSSTYWDHYVKFLYYGSEKGSADPGIRIFNKVGNAYGFLIDAAYFADFRNGIEFLLSAVIYCNSDGIFNDDKYDYAEVGFPYLKNLGKVIYEYELKRRHKQSPDLREFQFTYRE
jgi:hypothetical protein